MYIEKDRLITFKDTGPLEDLGNNMNDISIPNQGTIKTGKFA
jgi:hypothetical protein